MYVCIHTYICICVYNHLRCETLRLPVARFGRGARARIGGPAGTYIHTYVYTHMYTYIHTYIHNIYMYVYVYYTYTHVYTFTYFIYIRVYGIQVYIYIYIYAHTHTHTHIDRQIYKNDICHLRCETMRLPIARLSRRARTRLRGPAGTQRRAVPLQIAQADEARGAQASLRLAARRGALAAAARAGAARGIEVGAGGQEVEGDARAVVRRRVRLGAFCVAQNICYRSRCIYIYIYRASLGASPSRVATSASFGRYVTQNICYRYIYIYIYINIYIYI